MTKAQETVEPLRLNTTEAARALGVSKFTLWAYVTTGMLSVTAPNGRGPGRRVYFDRDEVEAFARGGPEAAKAYREKRDKRLARKARA